LEERVGVPVRKGSKHAVDLGLVIELADTLEFSHSTPACELIASKTRERAFETMSKLEESADQAFSLGALKIGGSSRMKVMAEVVAAETLTDPKLEEIIHLYVFEGADIIDLGISLGADADDVSRVIQVARRACEVPISIDTLEPDLLALGVGEGVDLLLSLNGKNMDTIGPLAHETDTPCVIIPDLDHQKSETAVIESLEKNIDAAREHGIKRIIADPILNPPCDGLAESLVRYAEFHREHPEIPLFCGVGNVSELLDVDSTGVNGLLAGIGSELGASILFTPEFSDKNRGSIRELTTASQMMQLSLDRESPPKDLGIDLLELKEKRRRPFETPPEEFTPARPIKSWRLDPAGSVRISITERTIENGKIKEGVIIAEHRNGVVVGRNTCQILTTLIEEGCVSLLDHAGYLGRELTRAELALRLGRSYNQDDEF
ncbi:MAG TPA: dihydropteroate synthase-like protein, partial [Candidatus Methanoperedenaceae archaeon]|nr:dihydropteroate synthase-like protein [Candidatus Methanoperedenaceae archaeon]